jgi:nucleotide-binding universal stress UspA family protein
MEAGSDPGWTLTSFPQRPHHRGENGRTMATAQLTPIGVGIHNVLIATDFSSCSNQALNIGLKLAKEHLAQAHVVLVVPSEEFMIAGPAAYVAARNAAVRDLEALKVELQNASGYVEGSDYHLYLLEGYVAPSILNFAQQKQIDLIVMGTHGRGGLGKALMGSVSELVFRGSAVPVMTIGPHAKHVVQAPKPKNILVAADFTAASERAAHYAAGMASEYKSKLTLLHVLNPKQMSHVQDKPGVIQETEAKLAALLGPGRSGSFTSRVEIGRVVPTILQTAHGIGGDLLVMGVRPAIPALSRFMWPNAYEIVRESSCPVLTVRESAI